tara:strand:+ start:953 stop:1252 length:300 start_codon:yes stop_codon:yes gene_type:complete
MAREQVKSIINILTKKPSLESEFAIESSIAELHSVKDINELKELASQLARANHKQSQFIANALEIMCNQQDMINYLQRKKSKKKAPLMKRISYIFFGKD